jgi:transcription termination factor Rho
MIDAGWRKNSFKAGDEVTATVRPAKSGKPVGAIVRVEFADGKTLGIGGTEAVGNEFHLSGALTK